MTHPARDPHRADPSYPQPANSPAGDGSGGTQVAAGDAATCMADVAGHVGRAAVRDELLHAVRRIDWRFLMPRPTLGHVALLGDDDPELVRALRWFSASLSMLDLDWHFPSEQAPKFDQVVLRARGGRRVDNAMTLVEPGGVLYWEIERGGSLRCRRVCLLDFLDRAWSFAIRRRRAPYEPYSLRRIRKRFERAGFVDVRWHWHRPGFHDALDIVPLRSETVLNHLFGKHNGRARGRVKRGVGKLLQKIGLLHVLVPCVSLMATKKTG